MVQRFFGDPLQQFRQPEDLRWYDVMQVCINGHRITARLKSNPEHGRDYCPDCGARTVSKCGKCSGDIPGYYHVPNVFGPDPDPPTHCDGCGEPFPWHRRKQREKLSPAAQKALEGFERQLERLHRLAADFNPDDLEFIAWRDTTVGLFDRLLAQSPHASRFRQIRFRPSVSDELTADEISPDNMFQRALGAAEQCLLSAIEEIEDFDITVAASGKAEERSIRPGSIQQIFHGPVTIHAQQLAAAEKAVQKLRQTNTDLSRTFGSIAQLLGESQELKGREIREGFEAIEVLSSEMQKAEQNRNWQRILDYAHKLLGVVNSATDIVAKVAPYVPSLSGLIDQAKRLVS